MEKGCEANQFPVYTKAFAFNIKHQSWDQVDKGEIMLCYKNKRRPF